MLSLKLILRRKNTNRRGIIPTTFSIFNRVWACQPKIRRKKSFHSQIVKKWPPKISLFGEIKKILETRLWHSKRTLLLDKKFCLLKKKIFWPKLSFNIFILIRQNNYQLWLILKQFWKTKNKYAKHTLGSTVMLCVCDERKEEKNFDESCGNLSTILPRSNSMHALTMTISTFIF